MKTKTMFKKISALITTAVLLITGASMTSIRNAMNVISISVSAAAPSIEVKVHEQNKGWLEVVKDGVTAGTTGLSLALECIKIRLIHAIGGIRITTHQANVGWVSYKSANNGTWIESGTTGQSRAIEAVRIQLTGAISSQYDIYYRVHVAYIGWLGWARNNEIAGSVGLGLRTEALQVKLVKKGTSIARCGTAQLTKPTLTYRTHVQDKGTLSYVKEGNTSGTTGEKLRMEGLWTIFTGFDGKSGISVRVHVSDIGWQNWVSSGQMAGTSGQAKQIEAVQIKLSPLMANIFDVYYRLHVQDIGWMGYAKNGETAGTTGYGYRAEAIQIVIVNKGVAFNRGNTTAFKQNNSSNTTSSSSNYIGFVSTSSSPLILRSGAGTSYSKLVSMPKGSTVTVIDNKKKVNDFYHVIYNGITGYASAQYITFNQPTPSTALDKLMNKFPVGKYWNHAGSSQNNPDGYTNTPCTHHGHCSSNGYGGACGCNSFQGIAIQCFGFAYKCGYDAYGSNPANWSKVYNLNNLKAGDIVRYKNNGHSIFVTAVNGNTVTYGDCNSDGHCKIRWNQTISKSTLASTLTNVCVAPYSLS